MDGTLKKPFASIHNVPKHSFANSKTTSRNFTHCCFNHDSIATKPRGPTFQKETSDFEPSWQMKEMV